MSACIKSKEPVLLVGNTGCGKTTVCQLLSKTTGIPLTILNCHQHTETADMVGGLRPVRNKESIFHTALKKAKQIVNMIADCNVQGLTFPKENILSTIVRYHDTQSLLNECKKNIDLYIKGSSEMSEGVLINIEGHFQELKDLHKRYIALFEWQDGPLVKTMKTGEYLLLDELSLAEDAVLERLNSVLEPSRTVVLAEKGGDSTDAEIVADTNFRIFATMNPGGDFGKKELSPALRNRFTEIWVSDIDDQKDLKSIIEKQLSLFEAPLGHFASPLLTFVNWFNGGADENTKHSLASRSLKLTLRDILSWAHFIGTLSEKVGLDPWLCYVHGASLVLLDGLGLGAGLSSSAVQDIRKRSYTFLISQVPQQLVKSVEAISYGKLQTHTPKTNKKLNIMTLGPFQITLGPHGQATVSSEDLKYSLGAPTTSLNLARVMRGLQLKKPILLEGSPGVGKTSLISALAKASGHNLVRINLSEQSDISDLLGSDLPVPSTSDNEDAQFAWCDGVFLQALQAGDWVLLDELNLAPQAVLEGLNACLDHRSTVYIPEIDRAFACPSSFRVFAAQNPLQEGGGRKGLPRSFLNRFTKVFVEALSHDDLLYITSSMFPKLVEEENQFVGGRHTIEKMIKFNTQIQEDTMVAKKYGRQGAPGNLT